MQKFKNFVLQFWQVKFWDFEKISPKRHKKIARKPLFSKKFTTERSEVSINSKRILNFSDFFCCGLRLATRRVALC